MKTCPSCGYRDKECWRNHRWIIYVQYCDISELEFFDQDLAKECIEIGPTEKMPLIKPPFVYVLKKAGYVWRMDLEDYRLHGYSRTLTESPKYAERLKLAEAQTRILNFMETEK